MVNLKLLSPYPSYTEWFCGKANSAGSPLYTAETLRYALPAGAHLLLVGDSLMLQQFYSLF